MAESPKRRVLFVDRTPRQFGTEYIISALSGKYDITFHPDLDFWILDYLKQSFASPTPQEALISHVPDERGLKVDASAFGFLGSRRVYQKSLNILSAVRDMSENFPIIAYTGADNQSGIYSHLDTTFDRVIKKGWEPEKDLHEIDWSLDYAFNTEPQNRIRRLENMKIPPQIRRENGKTLVDALVNVKGGILPGIVVTIVEETTKYPGSVRAQNLRPDCGTGEVDGKSVMGLVTTEAMEGDILRLSIEGEGEQAEILARRLYSAITSDHNLRITLDRFTNNQTRNNNHI